eukprot:TRINITY_DN438_c1_g1_i1.p1 TRINITY_DN438_c1_g1~~TRINITY_DN438_c1_g1_i1.p1  ORF type:complete len:943 (-),score=241.02 TRINITY_DN438_c1_g1_i1:28-2823(-)
MRRCTGLVRGSVLKKRNGGMRCRGRKYVCYSTSAQEQQGLWTESERRNVNGQPNVYSLVNAYRQHGHLESRLDPLNLQQKGVSHNVLNPEFYGITTQQLDQEVNLEGIFYGQKSPSKLKDSIETLKQIYTSQLGADFSHLPLDEYLWFAKQVETHFTQPTSPQQKQRIHELLTKSEVFDHFMHTRYRTTKRYGLEGCESMMPCMDTIFRQAASKHGVEDIVIGMPHRGRLNFLYGILNYPAQDIFRKAKGGNETPDDANKLNPLEHAPEAGNGDVMSHIAHSVDLDYEGKSLHVSLIHNPSHLEAANPVAAGKTRAKIDGGSKALCITVHGDAAFTGQGVVMETLILSQLEQYKIGGTIHVIVNNQVGFTAEASQGRSSRYASDIAKLINAPTLHVHADSPEAVVKATEIAVEYQQRFKKDVVIDIIGYRRHGHNELDEPSFTQPLMYQIIRDKTPTVVTQYTEQLVTKEQILTEEKVKALQGKFFNELDEQYKAAQTKTDGPGISWLKNKWSGMKEADDMIEVVETGVELNVLKDIAAVSVNVEQDKVVAHPRLSKGFIGSRKEAIQGGQKIDWPTSEALAFGSLMAEGHNVRLSGQDVGRGTFSHRHVKIIDQNTGKRNILLNQMKGLNSNKKGQLTIADSPLSEFGVMGYEYGYSIEDPSNLVIWEAQFGDFGNGAQIIIDQFLSSGETKWWRQTGLTLALPHGYDGAGPEHSSCRMERFLQLCDGDSVHPNRSSNKLTNMQVVYPSTPANYFHLIRRQLKRSFRKPLVIVGPKTMLRDENVVSKLEDFAPGTSFKPILTEEGIHNASRIIFCTGKIYYELVKYREDRGIKDTIIVRIEELSPFPYGALEEELGGEKYRGVGSYVWCQEEPQNAGAWSWVKPRFEALLGTTTQVQFVGRPPAASSAVGFAAAHKAQQKALIEQAFSVY